MALVLSGALSMGGSTADRSINCELGCLGTDQISLDDAAARALAGVPSGEIAIDDFYGASSAPTVLGQEFEGGYYMGLTGAYYMLAAPNATGCTTTTWGPLAFVGGTSSSNGYNNSYNILNSATYPAAYHATTNTSNGYTDWYMPSRTEYQTITTNKACPPVGETYTNTVYFTSTEFDTSCPFTENVSTGAEIVDRRKNLATLTRAVRRVPV